MNKWFHVFSTNGRNCYGVTLWRWKALQIELWLCPPNFSVGEHIHREFDGEIVLLMGNVNLCKRVNGAIKSTGKYFRRLSVPRNTPHWFTPKSGLRVPTVFFNIELWHTEPSSACLDFVRA